MKEMSAEGKSEEEILEETDKVEYYPPRREGWKALTLKKWYDVVLN